MEATLVARSLSDDPLFRLCTAEELAALAASVEAVQVKAGASVFREGDAGDAMYVIESGDLRVVSDVETEKVVFAHLGPGDFFGEMALITGEARSAGVIATTGASLLRLSKDHFDKIRTTNAQVSAEINRVLGERLMAGNVRSYRNDVVTFFDLTPERQEVTIGRLPDNDLVVDDPQVDGLHARIARRDGTWVITDAGSATGTFVNRERITSRELRDGDEVLIGTNKVFIQGLAIRAFSGREGIRIDAVSLVKELPGGKRILDDISLSIQPGEFVAVVGGSGSGKTSLLHALNGFSPASSGDVHFNGLDVYENLDLFRSRLGYVPQDDIVHRELTVERTLYFGARLRLPSDTSAEEIKQRVDEALDSVELTHRRDTEIKKLSGGQRKRVSIALELLAKPKAIFLDEPTSGLDPALEGRMTSLFRELAEHGATVVASTHFTDNLSLCDKVIWLAPGGKLVFFGSPAECLRHFGVTHFSKVYEMVDEEEEIERWSAAYAESPAHKVNVKERLADAPHVAPEHAHPDASAHTRHTSPAGQVRQLYWLTRRYIEILLRDLPGLALLLIQAPAIGGALLLLFEPGIFEFEAGAGGNAIQGVMAMHMITASAIFLGASNAAREITREAAIYARERLVNLHILPYVGSKVLVLGALCAFQAVALVGIMSLRIEFPGLGSDVYIRLFVLIFVTELVGLTMGLLISAVSHNSHQAMALVPILLIPQLIFAGALVPVESMLPPARVLAHVMISKYALDLSGSITELGPRLANQFPEAVAQPYMSAFDVPVWIPWVVLSGMALIMTTGTALILKSKDVS